MNTKTLAILLISILSVSLLVTYGYFAFMQNSSEPESELNPTPEPTPTPTPTPEPESELNPTLELLAGGTKWAAQEGDSVLFINWKDNWDAHYTTDGVNWEWYSEEIMDTWRASIMYALLEKGFTVSTNGDLPEDLYNFDVVVIFAYYAIDPSFELLIQEYIRNGGGIVLLAGVPTYLSTYSKSLSSTSNLQEIENWFGANTYTTGAGPSRVAFDYPFGTSLNTTDIIYINTSGEACVSSLNNEANPIAILDSGKVFAFTHEFGAGRVYYQSIVQEIYAISP